MQALFFKHNQLKCDCENYSDDEVILAKLVSFALGTKHPCVSIKYQCSLRIGSNYEQFSPHLLLTTRNLNRPLLHIRVTMCFFLLFIWSKLVLNKIKSFFTSAIPRLFTSSLLVSVSFAHYSPVLVTVLISHTLSIIKPGVPAWIE